MELTVTERRLAAAALRMAPAMERGSIGVDATEAELNALADKLDADAMVAALEQLIADIQSSTDAHVFASVVDALGAVRDVGGKLAEMTGMLLGVIEAMVPNVSIHDVPESTERVSAGVREMLLGWKQVEAAVDGTLAKAEGMARLP